MVSSGSWLSKTALPRALRALPPTSNSEEAWAQFYDDRDKQMWHVYHRLNLPLDYLPPLDCSEAMDDLRDTAKDHIQTDHETIQTVNAITKALLTTQFFFELTEHPTFVQKREEKETRRIIGDFWKVSGIIRCGSPNALALINQILAEYPEPTFKKDTCHGLGTLDVADVCRYCMFYEKHVDFTVPNLETAIQISLELRAGADESSMCAISAFQTKQKIKWSVEQQTLHSPFPNPAPPRTNAKHWTQGTKS